MPPRILYVNKSIVDSNQANAIHVRQMYRALVRAGADVRLLARYERSNAFAQPLLRRRAGTLDTARLALRARSISAGDVDCIYGRHLPSLVAACGIGPPVIYESHAISDGLAHHLERMLLRSPSLKRVTVISDQLKRDFLFRHTGFDRDRIEVLRDAADIPDNSHPNKQGRAGGRIQCGYVGNLYPGTGADLLPKLAARVPECDFHLVGGDHAELASFRRRIGIALPSNLRCHGSIPHESVQGIYDTLDIALLPLQSVVRDMRGANIGRWTSPLKMFEYMASGLSIIASDLPILREVLRDRETALLARHDSLDAWVQGIRELAASTELRRALGRQARKEAKEKYSWDARARRVLAMVEHVS